MAKKEKKEAKIVMERTYNVPLRKEFMKSPRWKRTKKAVKALREFTIKHMKSDKVKVGKYVNLELWKHGIKNPPHHVKVNCTKDEEGNVFVELVGAPKEVIEKKPKKEKVKEKKEVKEEKKEGAEKKLEEIKEEKKEEAREIEKEEIKELKRKQPKVRAPKEAAKPKDLHLRKKEMIPGR